jgi:hypothetical protein
MYGLRKKQLETLMESSSKYMVWERRVSFAGFRFCHGLNIVAKKGKQFGMGCYHSKSSMPRTNYVKKK